MGGARTPVRRSGCPRLSWRVSLAAGLLMYWRVKLKDYEIPQYPLDGGLDQQEDLARYSLKNFDLSAVAATPEALPPSPVDPNPWGATPEPPPKQWTEPAPQEPWDVQFGAHFNLQTVSYVPPSPTQPWKLPRWVITTVGLFFGSAAVLMVAFCVVLLRDPTPAPTAPSSVPTPSFATTSAAPAPSAPSSPAETRAAPAPARQTIVARHDVPARGHRIVSRHPSVGRRQSYGPRHVASKSTSAASDETETVTRPPPRDALDQLLSESSL